MATGGAGGEHIVLDSLSASAFIDAVSNDEARWITFAPGLSGAIELTRNLNIGSNTTIDGRAADIALTAPGGCHEIRFWGEHEERQNLIIHNIQFRNIGTGDNCGQAFGMAFNAHTMRPRRWMDL